MADVDVLSTTVTGDATAVSARARIKGMLFNTNGTAGSVVLKDGGSGGTTKLTINTPAVTDIYDTFIPGDGILFRTDVYVDVTNVTSVTLFYTA